ncbi:MAG: DUF2867 domain-containing protein [Rhodomicrobium sp.]
MKVQAVEPGIEPGELLPGAQFADAYGLTVEDPALGARQAAEKMWGSSQGWMNALMAVRNLVVTPFGLKTPAQGRTGSYSAIGIFPVVSEAPNRVVLGFDDKHLDFRVIVDAAPTGNGRRVTATTLVRTHNLLGRAYLAAVLPFHRVIVRSMLRKLLARHPELK